MIAHPQNLKKKMYCINYTGTHNNAVYNIKIKTEIMLNCFSSLIF